MIYFNLVMLLLFLTLFALSFKNREAWLGKLNKTEHKLYLLYPLSYLILNKTRLYKVLNRKRDMEAALKSLFYTGKPELISRLYWCRRVSMILIALVIFNLMSVFAVLSSNNNTQLIDGKYIRRPDPGEGRTDIEVQVSMIHKNTTDNADQRAPDPLELTIPVDEQYYTQKELDELIEKSSDYMQQEVLGSNRSAEEIDRELNFIKTIPGTGIDIDWVPEDYNLIQSDGRINNSEISSGGVWTDVTAILSYGDKQKGLSRELRFTFKIIPRQYSEEETVKQELKEEITQADDRTEEDEYLKLPDTLTKYLLVWNVKSKSSSGTLLLLGTVLAAVLWILDDKELENKLKKRKEQMLIDYPEIINKFTLLINAGMTIKQTWIKIADDYVSKLTHNKESRRYAYEEILVTARELKLGLAENISYEQFGRRTGLTAYMKFSSLISQNLMKGTKGFTQLLMHEAAEAFEERKETVKRLGEVAGTKLLLPMMIMLIIVLLMIMIPAFLSFRIQG